MATLVDNRAYSNLDGSPYKQVAESANALLSAIASIERLAAPKQFRMMGCYLMRYDSLPSNGRNHYIRAVGDEPIDETYAWQITGTVGGRVINAVAVTVFHTHKENRSGAWQRWINGKDPSLKPEYGGVTLDDLWQDADLWREAREAALQEAK